MIKRFRSYQLLWPLVAPYRYKIAQAFFALLMASAFTLTLPILVKLIVSAALANDLAGLQWGFVYVLGASLGLGLFSAYRFYMVSWLGERVVAQLRKKVFGHLTKLTPSFYDQNLVGELTSRLTTDSTLVEQVVGTSFSVAIRNAILLIGSAVFLLMTSVYLSLMMCVVTPLVIVPVIYFARKYRLLSKESQGYVAESNAYANQVLSLIDTVRAYQYEKAAYGHFSDVVESGFDASKRRIWARSQLTLIITVCVISAMVAVLWLGTLEVYTGTSNLTAGDIGQFFGYAVYISVAVAALSEVWGDLMRASGALSRIIDILAEPVIQHEGKETVLDHAIEFKQVSFSYPSRTYMQVLQSVNFAAKRGEVTALVGMSGAGKSTLFKLLMGFYTGYSGEICVGGKPINSLNLESLRGSIALVSHQVGIFPLSIRDNILMGVKHSDDHVMHVASLASIDQFIETLPDGLDTVVGERGVLLSEGQRQRLALARAIIRDADIILLDEATNALDAITEDAINRAMKEVFASKTVLVIAHRLATVMDADHIVVLDHGQVHAEGTHTQLSKRSDIYQQIASLQMVIK